MSRTVIVTTFDSNGVQTGQQTLTLATRPEEDVEATVRAAAATAVATNTTSLAVAAPTNAQVVAQVRALTRQNNALIRLVLGLFDSAD